MEANNCSNQDLISLEQEFYHKLRQEGKSPNTLKNYKTDLDCFNKYLIDRQSSLNLKDFQSTKVMEYGTFLTEKYNSDNSRRRRVQALRIFFDFLVERELYSENPVKKLPPSPKFLDIPRPTPFNDVKTLWIYLNKHSKKDMPLEALINKRNQLVVLLVYGSALKVSDLSGLKMEHITIGENESRVMIIPPRRDPYSVPLTPTFNKVFSDYKVMLATMKEKSNVTFDHVLFNANPYRILSGGLSSRGLEVIFEELRNKLGITLTPKSLRQSCIMKWINEGKADTLIKEGMGVAPSYSLKLYKEHAIKYLYNDTFLEEIYREFNPVLN